MRIQILLLNILISFSIASCRTSYPVQANQAHVINEPSQPQNALQMTSEHTRYLNWIDSQDSSSFGVACLSSEKMASPDASRMLELKARADFVSKRQTVISGSTHFDSLSSEEVTQSVQAQSQGYASKGEIMETEEFILPEGKINCVSFRFKGGF